MRNFCLCLFISLLLCQCNGINNSDTCFRTSKGYVKLQVIDDDIVRVMVSPVDTFSSRQSLSVTGAPKDVQFSTSESDTDYILSTSCLTVQVNKSTGKVVFKDTEGNVILSERDNGTSIVADNVCGENTWNVRQQWEGKDDEVILGLGHHQNDLYNLKGADIDLWQENWEIAVPFFLSNRGYGILWDNYSHSKFGFPVTQDFIPCELLYDKEGKQGALTGSYYNGVNFDELCKVRRDSVVNFDFKTFGPQVDNSFTTDPDWVSKPLDSRINPGKFTVRWEGQVKSLHEGEYTFNTFTTHKIKLWVNDSLIVDGYNTADLYLKGKIYLAADTKYNIRYEWQKDVDDKLHEPSNGAVQLRWSPPAKESYDEGITMWSEVGDMVDYYFVYGPDMDNVISGYRHLTGKASILPRWAYGFWHSHIGINTQKEYLELIDEFRNRQIPIDVLVQDLGYWGNYPWGSHQFDETRYPDPVGMIAKAHEKNINYIISVWGMFQRGSDNWKELLDNDQLFRYNNCSFWTDKGTWYYNPFSQEGRDIYWKQMRDSLYNKGVDAWWLDASEPEISTPADPFLYKEVMENNLGTGARYLNAFSLMQTKGIYEGQRKSDPDNRVVILARSAFAGQQSYATVMWTGDITATWDVFRKQIKCGLNFASSGLPYWTTDIGGFFVNTIDWPLLSNDPGYRELYTRWFQWATFCPVMRAHGNGPRREMWKMGNESYKIQKEFTELRYRLSPYIYTLGGMCYKDDYTMMRPLIFDFNADKNVHSVYDQYMFGPSLMVCPVLQPSVKSRSVYLPETSGWYSFWNNGFVEGGQTVTAQTPMDKIPVYVKAGSILPLSRVKQYMAETDDEELTINVYTGADGQFTLYNDHGDNFDYEKGLFTEIPFKWNDKEKTLIIGERKGEYSTMVKSRKFIIRFISPDGESESECIYDGKEQKIQKS